MRSNRPMRLAAVLVGGLLLAAGCGKTETPAPSGAPTTSGAAGTTATTDGLGSGLGKIAPSASAEYMQEAAKRTSDTATGEFTVTFSVVDNPVLGDGEQTLATMEGAYDRDADLTRMVIDLAGLGAVDPSFFGDAESEAERKLLEQMLADPMTLISDGSTQYIKSPIMSKLLGGGKEWLKTAGSGGNDLSEDFSGFQLDDVAAFVETLDAAGDVEEVGTEDVAGVDATHYHAEADLSQLDGSGPSGTLLSDLGAAGTAVIDVWIDADGLVRRLRIEAGPELLADVFDVPVEGTGGIVDVEFASLGEPVDIEIPDPADVKDMDDDGARPTTTEPDDETTTTRRRATTTTEP